MKRQLRKKSARIVLLLFVNTFLLFFYQNCAPAVSEHGQSSNASGGNSVTTTPTPTPSPTVTPSPTPTPTVTPSPTPTPTPTPTQPAATLVYPLSTDLEFKNPERGFSKYQNFSSFTTSSANSIAAGGFTLVGIQIDLRAYITTPDLPDSFITQYQNMFAIARSKGLKLIMTHRYHNNHDFVSDPSQDIIKAHINELAPIMGANADVIQVVHGGFIGAYGEMYYSQHRTDLTFRRWQVHTLLNALPPSIHVSLRYPAAKRQLYNMTTPNVIPVLADEPYAKRVSHWNDCFVSSGSDVGTNLEYSTSFNPSDWRDFVGIEAKALALPVGGETCAVAEPYSACANTLVQMERQAWTYINDDYNPDVKQGWINNGCFNEIKRNLGYRLRINEVSFPSVISKSMAMNIAMKIQNLGYSAPIHNRPLKLVLFNSSGEHKIDIIVNVTNWKKGIHSISQALSLANVPVGLYNVALWLPDATTALQSNTAYSLRFANDNAWDAVKGWNIIKNGANNIQVQVTN